MLLMELTSQILAAANGVIIGGSFEEMATSSIFFEAFANDLFKKRN